MKIPQYRIPIIPLQQYNSQEGYFSGKNKKESKRAVKRRRRIFIKNSKRT